MNAAHIHLLLNHFPIIGWFFSFLLLAVGVYRKNKDFIRAALLITAVTGVIAVPTYLTGEPAEDSLKSAPNFVEDIAEEHEEAAEFAIWTICITAVASAIGLYFSIKKDQIPKPLFIAIVLLQLFTFTVIARTNYLGGQINHTEIRK